MAIPRSTAIGAGFLGLLLFWGLAALVAIDDIDFFSLEDFGDTSGLHHEHIFFALALLGLVASVVPLLVWSRPRG